MDKLTLNIIMMGISVLGMCFSIMAFVVFHVEFWICAVAMFILGMIFMQGFVNFKKYRGIK